MDKVSGLTSSSGGRQSDNNNCNQCVQLEKFIRASGFCRACLCTYCLDQHKTLSELKSHHLLGSTDVPDQKSASSDLEDCPVPPDRPIEDRSCRNIAVVPELPPRQNPSKRLLSVWDTLRDQFTLKHFELPSGTSNEDILKTYFTSHAKTQPVAGLCSKDTTENGSNINIGVQAQSFPATKCISSYTLNIKSPEEGKNDISCITEFSTTELLFTDMSQRCLTLFDITSNTTIKKRVLISWPWDTTMLPWSKIAVTLPHSKQIEFFTADHFLFPCCSIDVFGECRGIQCAENKLVVSFTSPHALVQIIDLSGRVLKTIRHDPSGCELFEWPHYIALCPDNKLIYVSDYYRHTISCIDTDGVIKWVYQDGDTHYQKGIVAGDGGCIYVCSWRSNTIHVVSSSDGDRLAFIKCYGVTFPQAACYSSKNQALYVSHGNFVTSISRLSLQ